MQFSAARPDVVQAINQRWLLKFWRQHMGAHRVPQWQAIEAEDLSHMSANLSFLDVIGGNSGNGDLRFRIRFHGELVGKVFGSPDCRGLFLHESKPEPARAQALAPYRRAVASGRPVYLVHDVADRQGRLVHYERLLLPFARDGANVDRILASFEFICADGAFDGHALMTTLAAPPALRLSATIEPQALA
jgi:hypothetical protein